jgi:hypothetical protein
MFLNDYTKLSVSSRIPAAYRFGVKSEKFVIVGDLVQFTDTRVDP